nr:LysR family transcriptional regulator [uncultured Gellertiella sp.]
MHWDLRHARTFIAVADSLSFSVAAQQLGTTQSAVSRTIAYMETELGLPLLVRSSRHVALTAEGRLLLEECREVVARFTVWTDRARRMASGSVGEIEIGVNDFVVQAELPRLLHRFQSQFPEIGFRFTSASRQAILERLEHGQLHVAFVMGPVGNGRFSRHETGRYGLNCLVRHGHRLTRLDSVSLKDLTGERLIVGHPDDWQSFHQYLERGFQSAGVAKPQMQFINESVAIFGLVAAGAGVALYPDCQQNTVLREVTALPVGGLTEDIRTLAIWDDQSLSRSGRLFIDYVLQESGRLPDAAHGQNLSGSH